MNIPDEYEWDSPLDMQSMAPWFFYRHRADCGHFYFGPRVSLLKPPAYYDKEHEPVFLLQNGICPKCGEEDERMQMQWFVSETFDDAAFAIRAALMGGELEQMATPLKKWMQRQ